MIKIYKLDDSMQDAIESLELYKEHEEDLAEDLDRPLIINRDPMERHVEDRLSEVGLLYKKIKRKNTTSYVIHTNVDGEEEEGKITVRFDDNSHYASHKYYNMTFERDLEFYVGDF